MEINQAKREVLHLGRSNAKKQFTVMSKILSSIYEQRHVEFQTHSSLKVATQVDRVVKKA